LIGVLYAAGAGLLTIGDVRADAYPGVSELVQYLENQYRVSITDLARYLSLTGTNVKDQTQSRLARWPNGEFRVSIVVAGDARDEARSLANGMIELFNQIHRRSKICIQSVEVAEGSGDYVPDANEMDCLSREHDIVVVVDASSHPITKLLEGLRQMSDDQVTQNFWEKRARDEPAQSDSSNCDAGYSIAQGTNFLSSGTIYLRISPNNRASQIVDICLAIMPFRILGAPPLPVADYRETFDSHFLLIMYSPELRPGMRQDEIEQALRHRPPSDQVQ
jgi:hypothetical protein